jgi:hypothetical protein
MNREGGFSMNTLIEVGWFIFYMVALNYAIKHLGAAKTFWWAFAVSSLLCLLTTFHSILRIINRHDGFLTLRSLLVPGVFSALAAIYGVAWWTVWKRKRSARACAIAACLTYILAPLFTIWSKLHFSRSFRVCSGVMLATGVIGLVAFLRQGTIPSGTEPVRN